MRLLILVLLLPSIIASASEQLREGGLTSPMDELENAIQQGRRSLTLHNDKTSHLEAVLQNSLKLVEDSASIATTIARHEELLTKVENLVSQLNMSQLVNLSKNLMDLLHAETTRRRVDNSVAGIVDSISLELLGEIFDAEKVFAASESQLEEWVSILTSEEISSMSKLEIAVVSSSSCVSFEQGAQKVQRAIMDFIHDNIGLKDHAQGSTIVYELTSPSYQPPVDERTRLGSWKWRRFIPEDWEHLLPQGWQHWNVGITSSLSSLLGQISPASVASPQTIFHPDTSPGSCWPFPGGQGLVTFRLPYPVHVSAVSLDHVSNLLLPGKQNLSSAPKDVSVYGFPPCDEPHCEGLGFDSKIPIFLQRISYDMEGSSTQTFPFVEGSENQKNEIEETETLEPGSCSAMTSTCGPTQTSKHISAIQMRVESNWGNSAYTCIYRFRVHGEAAE